MMVVAECEWLHVHHGYYIEAAYSKLLHYIRLNTNTMMPALPHVATLWQLQYWSIPMARRSRRPFIIHVHERHPSV
jgi:hypothetical protein